MENINDQHNKIYSVFDDLIQMIEDHIRYENRLLNLRNKIKPHHHPIINDELKKHKKDHIKLLNEFHNLKKSLEEHIKKYDNKQIHGLSKI